MIFKRYFSALKKLFNAKYVFEEPEKKNLLIFDGESLNALKNILPGFDYFILETRLSRIKTIYITPKIIISTLKNFKKNLFSSYLLSLIDSISPKVVFTFIDNSFKFSEMASQRHYKYKFVAIQNGARYEQKIFKILSEKKIVGKNYLKFNIPNFFCFGENEVQDYKKNNQKIKKFIKVGSLRVSNFLFSKKKKLKKRPTNEILLISDVYCWDLILNKANFPIEQGVAKLVRFCIQFAKKNKVKIKIATRNFKENFDNEKKFYKKHLSGQEYKYLTKNLFFRKKNFETYELMENSKVVVGTMSTLLRENLFINGKTLSCNFTGTSIFDFPINGLCSLKNCEFEIFESRLKKLLKISNSSYLKGINKKPSYLIYKDKTHSTIKLVRSKLKSFLK